MQITGHVLPTTFPMTSQIGCNRISILPPCLPQLKTTNATPSHILLSGNQPIHVNQVIEIDSNRSPKRLINAFPCVNSPYGQWVTIEGVYKCDNQIEAILRLKLMTIPAVCI